MLEKMSIFKGRGGEGVQRIGLPSSQKTSSILQIVFLADFKIFHKPI